MRMSCNGCRVLRKGCSENCSLRPCLQWIRSLDSQANATVFLAKFYGRAGLINLINAGPDNLRPVGLMCSGNWQRCQEAVESVLNGSTIMQVPVNDDDNSSSDHQMITPLKSCDIRHISKDTSSGVVHQQVKTRNGRFKRKATKVDASSAEEYLMNNELPSKFSITGWDCFDQIEEELKRAPSHDSFSVETVEPSLMLANRVEPGLPVKLEEDCDVGLELTLGLMSPA
ncbi:LOB domain-containing protein 42-like isoform X2 [Lycium barbarum]|uniref:LOB domain-containing protein 42-like isoform X2 n=1 Tax=Lycium barbarum TaxID=112863 RepID=UPI00293F4300|nr:LOB domain-containing protein 42-like isoform X2 [Lycium barbarum]